MTLWESIKGEIEEHEGLPEEERASHKQEYTALFEDLR
jgi:hypothetical protein